MPARFLCPGGVLLAAIATAMAAPPAHPVVPGLAAHPDLDPATAGALLLGELNCTSCHAAGDHARWIRRKAAPSPVVAGLRIRPAYLRRFIADPQSAKPGTTMPQVLGQLSEKERAEAVEALTHYLVRSAPKPGPFVPLDPESVARGRKLYHTVGCVACHDPEDRDLADSVPLGPLAEKYHLAHLVRYLEDPLAVRPGGRMPDLGLDHFEAVDIASFLLRDQKGDEPGFTIDDELANRGTGLFKSLGCAECHRAPDEAGKKAAPLRELNPANGCLSGKAGSRAIPSVIVKQTRSPPP